MPRPKTPPRPAPAPSAPASNPSSASRARPNTEETRRLTSERIADDVSAFCEGGGHIEVLEITRPRDASDIQPVAKTPVAPPRQPMRRKTKS